MENDYGKGIVLVLISALFWAVMGPIAKFIVADNVSLMTAMIFRGLFVFVVFLLWYLIKSPKELLNYTKDEIIFYSLSAVLSVAFAGGGYFMSLEYMSVAEAMILHYTFPMVTIFCSSFVTHEKVSYREITAGILILIGVYVGVGKGRNISELPIVGILYGIIAVIGIAGQALLGRKYTLKGEIYNPMKTLLVSHLIGAILLIIYKTIFLGWDDLNNVTPEILSWMTIQSTSGSVIAYSTYFLAFRYIPAAIVSLLCSGEMIFAMLFTIILLGVYPTHNQILGASTILLAIAIVTVRPELLRLLKKRIVSIHKSSV
ncbi:MAG: DMT family transporter [Synergistaceae bacterium]